MQRTDLAADLQALLEESRYAVLATSCPDGSPWNTAVATAFDDSLNLYWASALASQHSRNLEVNRQLFAIVFGGVGSSFEGKGLYLRMTAKALRIDAEVTEALKYYDADFFRGYQSDISFVDTCPTRLYKATPLELWTNQDSIQDGFFIDTRQRLA